MVFSSMSFLFVFLPAVLAGYYLIPVKYREGRNLLLLLFSLIFYGFGGLGLVPLILASITVNYVFARLVSQSNAEKHRRYFLITAIVCNLALLVWFKYAGFLSVNFAALGLPVPILKIVLPIGISFYTFQGMSYVIDVYRGHAKAETNIFHVALYISLFTQLVAGPIVRYTTIANEILHREESVDKFAQGGIRFLFGLSKKVLIANQLGQVADAAFSTAPGDLSTGFAWLGIVAYTAQIYFDFSGYSDMAIGLGKIFGFHFLENFNYPYIAVSITDFWRRWHISLSTWFRDYLYIPLGGNQGNLLFQIRNLFIIWLLTGAWHGAAWTFMFWGLFYALLLIGERYVWGRFLEKIPTVFRHIYALVLVMLGWVLFRSADVSQAFTYIQTMFHAGGSMLWDNRATYYLLEFRWEYLLAFVAALPVKKWAAAFLSAREEQRWAKILQTFGVPFLALLFGLLAIMQLISSSFNPFIYFQF